MKKILALVLVLSMVLAFAACGAQTNVPNEPNETPSTTEATELNTESNTNSDPATVEVMTYAEYAAAEIDAPVVIEAYVQATQSWWEDKITVYAQDHDGAYFIYELACSEEDSAKMIPGTKIRVTGVKGEWAGEVEIMNATFEFVDEADTYIAEALDATDLLADTDALLAIQNQKVMFNGMTVVSHEYKNETPGNDIYLTLYANDAEYSFCVESYLTPSDSDVYQTVANLVEGQIINVECFLYWYEGANPHITGVTVVE